MGQKEMTVNYLPTRTWNRLGMNESWIQINAPENSIDINLEHLAKGVLLEKDNSDIKWNEIETGLGREYDGFVNEFSNKNAGTNTNADEMILQTIVSSVNDKNASGDNAVNMVDDTEWTVLHLNYKDGSYRNRLYLDAKERTTLNVLLVFNSDMDAKGTSLFQVKIHAARDAKVRLQEVQLLGDGYTCLSDIGAVCDEGASFELLKLELGAGKVYAGCLTELEGKKSLFDAKIGYYTRENQKLDMNYTVCHRGKKTVSEMEVSGVLHDNSSKIFRGTIDFVPGCAGAKGTEREDVLMLGDDLINQTIPLILCAEEDVEGNHGASMGDLDEATLFYLCSRGLSREEAENMVARARIDALNVLVAEESVQKLVQKFMG